MSQTVYGYIRVSSKDQNIERQRKELIAYGVAPRRIYMDKLSGKDFNRPGYQKLTRRKVKPGDLIVVQSLDRLGRNYEEILEEWKWITRTRKVHIKILDMPILDTSVDQDLVGTLICNLVLELLSFVAENERKMIRQRQAEGIRIAKEKGVHLGRPQLAVPPEFMPLYQQWRQKSRPYKELIAQSGMSYQKFYRTCRKLRQRETNASR